MSKKEESQAGLFSKIKKIFFKTELVHYSSDDLVTQISINNAMEVKEILQWGVDPNACDNLERLPLFQAALRNRWDIIPILLEYGAKIDVQDQDGNTALMLASKKGCADAVEVLITLGCDYLMANYSGETAYDLAHKNGHDAVVKIIIERKDTLQKMIAVKREDQAKQYAQSVNKQQNQAKLIDEKLKEQAALAMKANQSLPQLELEQKRIAKFLKEKGVKEKQKDNALDPHQLWLLKKELLVPHASDEEAFFQAILLKHQKAFHAFLDQNIKLNFSSTTHKITPLVQAIRNNDLAFTNKLLESGAAVDFVEFGMSPLMEAVQIQSLPLVRRMINAKANINLIAQEKTPLMIAIEQGNIEILDLLLKNGADVHLASTSFSPITLLIMEDQLPMLERLKTHEIDLEKEFKDQSPLAWAVMLHKTLAIQTLIKAGVNINQKNKQGISPLIQAILSGKNEIVKLLLELGADPNAANPLGRTPLMLAAMENKAYLVKILLQHKADPMIKDNEGRTAMDIARIYALQEDIKNLLFE